MSKPASKSEPISDHAALGWLAALATVLIWAGNAIVTKMAAEVIAPGSIAFYRWALALVILAPFAGPAAWRNRASARKVWWQLVISSVLGMVIVQWLMYLAAETTTAINIGVIQVLMPLFSVLLASVLSSEKLTATRVIGGLVSISGLVYLTSRGNLDNLVRGGLHAGDALMLISVLANALYGVLLRRWDIKLSIWEAMFWQIAAATVILAPFWLLGTISPITTRSLPLILYAAIAASLLAPAGWMYGIGRLGAARAALTVNLLPIFTAIFAWCLIGEQLRYYHYVGGCVALVGVVIGSHEWSIGRRQHVEPGPTACADEGL